MLAALTQSHDGIIRGDIQLQMTPVNLIKYIIISGLSDYPVTIFY